MVMVNLDLVNENAVEIGADYTITVELNDAPALTEYTGTCFVKVNLESSEILIQPVITVLNHNSFSLSIPFTSFSPATKAGSYVYDVLFIRANPPNRFYACGGKIQLLKRVTNL